MLKITYCNDWTKTISFGSTSSILATEFRFTSNKNDTSLTQSAYFCFLREKKKITLALRKNKNFPQKIPPKNQSRTKAFYFCKDCCQHRKCLKILAQWTTMGRLLQGRAGLPAWTHNDRFSRPPRPAFPKALPAGEAHSERPRGKNNDIPQHRPHDRQRPGHEVRSGADSTYLHF